MSETAFMTVAKGVSLGPYELLTHIGAGGMGDVWRARDNRIGRDVAVKILPESYGEGDERVRRFEQEARAAGALNHPGLVTIFDVGTTGGAPYIVMELLEGETLRDAIGRTNPAPLPVRKAIDYGMQIASALAVAHEKGIIHRDLKPENLFITSDDRVKILDFGLAKLAGDAPDDNGKHKTARHLTSAGIVVGTPGYMSPEQARAHPLDHRTDVFSLGSVLYEMITGKNPFESESAVETMHAVLAVDPPPLSAVAANVPPALDAIVRHCMEKAPRDRFQSARDLAFQLRTLLPEAGTLTAGRQPRLSVAIPRVSRRTVLGTLTVLALAAAAAFAIYRVFAGTEPKVVARTFRQLTYADGLESFPSLAPDGKSFAYVSSQSGNRDIYVQRVDGRIPVNITSDSPDDDSQPAFSPDGSQIVFRSERSGGGIFVMGVTGESVRRLTSEGFNPSWSPDWKSVVYSTETVEMRPHVHPGNGMLWMVDVRTEARRQLTSNVNDDAVQPSWSPHGKRIAFWGVAGSPSQRSIWTLDPAAPNVKASVVPVTTDSSLLWNPVWSPDGRYLYYGSNSDGTQNLWRIPIDEDSGRPAGAPEPLSLPAPFSGHYAFSGEGTLLFSTASRSYRLLALPFDASTGVTGEGKPVFGGTQEILTFEPSPDGSSIVFTTTGPREDVFIANADGTRLRQLTNDDARDRGATWSPDGTTLYFYSNRDGGVYHVWSIRADGGGLTRVTDAADFKRLAISNIYLPTPSPDGRTLAAVTDGDTFLIHLGRPAGQRIDIFVPDLGAPKWSPDGKQFLAQSDVNGDVVVVPLATRRPEQVLGPNHPAVRWLPDSRHVAYFENDKFGIIDLQTRQITHPAFPALPGADFDHMSPRFSADGSTMFVRQTLEQGDVWMMEVKKD